MLGVDFQINTGITETITSTDSVAGRYSASLNTGTQSITAADSVAGTYRSVALTSGTESVTSTDSVVGRTPFSVAVIESMTSTDSVVGLHLIGASITEQNGEITPYAATQVSVYQSSNVDVLVTPFLNLDDTVNRA